MWPRLYLIDSICVNKYKAICFHVLGFKFQNPKDKLCKTQVVSKSLVLHFSHVWGMYINIRDYLLRIRNSSKTFNLYKNPTSLRSKLSYYVSIKNTSSCTFSDPGCRYYHFMVYIIFDIWFFVKRVDEMYWKRYYIKKISSPLFLTA